MSLRLTDDELSTLTFELLLVSGRLVNGANQPSRSARVFMWLEQPGGQRVSVLPDAFAEPRTFPAGLNIQTAPLAFGAAGQGLFAQPGEYVLGVRIVDLTTGAVLTADKEPFVITP